MAPGAIRFGDHFDVVDRSIDQTTLDFLTHAAPHITERLEDMRNTKQDLFNLWSSRKLQLDQCFQMQLFEQDSEKVRRC